MMLPAEEFKKMRDLLEDAEDILMDSTSERGCPRERICSKLILQKYV